MKRFEYFKIGISLIAVALLFGVLPAAAMFIRNATGNPDASSIDSTQQSSDMGSALSYLGFMMPVAIVGVVMIVLGFRKTDD